MVNSKHVTLRLLRIFISRFWEFLLIVFNVVNILVFFGFKSFVFFFFIALFVIVTLKVTVEPCFSEKHVCVFLSLTFLLIA